MLIFVFLRLHRPNKKKNIEFGGRGYRRINRIDANKIEQMLKYRKPSFPKCLN